MRDRHGPQKFPESEDENQGSAEFAKLLEQYESSRAAPTPEVGRQIHGRIVLIEEETSFVDFGGRSEGAVETIHLRDADGNLLYQVGDYIDLFVVESTDQVVLAPSVRAEPELAMARIQEARRAGMPVTGKVVGLNTGGLEVDLGGLRAFCPVSQVEMGYCENPSVYAGRSIDFLVTEVAEGGRRLVVSRRALLRREEEEKARRFLETLVAGAEVDGTVARLESFGAFVDLGGIDGLLHVSEIRWERTESPSDVLAVGQKVRVKVLEIRQKEGGRPRISLSMKAVQPDPWDDVNDQFWVGQHTRGTVVRLADFGAFVNLSAGIDGLVHVSEIDLRPVAHPRDALTVGQAVEIVVLSIDLEKRRISLSIRDALASAQDAESGLSAAEVEGSPGLASSRAAATLRNPTVGDLADGWVAGIKTYGLFVDLPAYGHRARGLVPHEETGEKRGTDLAKRFRVGDQLKVAILDVDAEGKIRLSMVRAQEKTDQDSFQAHPAHQARQSGGGTQGPNTAMGEALRKAMERSRKKDG